MDLKKEIKLSDLFRRKKGPESEVEPSAPKEARKSRFSRGPKEPKPEKEPKAPKEKKPKAAAPAPARPAIPLMRAFDLMPKDGDRPAGEKKSGPGLSRVAVALLGILVLAGLAAGFMLMGARAGERRAQVDDLRVELAELTAAAPTTGGGGGGDPSTSLAGESQARTAALSEALAGRIAWDRILREFSLVVPEDVLLTSLALTSGDSADPASGATFTLEGIAGNQGSVALLLSRLSLIPEFGSVQLQSSAEPPPPEGEEAPAVDVDIVTFTIVATLALETVAS